MTGNPRTSADAIAWGMSQIGGPKIWSGLCDHFVAQCYGWGNSGFISAKDQWNSEAIHNAPSAVPPAGALCFWDTGSYAFDHVALSCGDGTILSTDISYGQGEVTRVPLTLVSQKWGCKYLGWTDPNFLGRASGRAPGAPASADSVSDFSTSAISSDSNTNDAAGLIGGASDSPADPLGTQLQALTTVQLWERIGMALIGVALLYAGVYTFMGKAALSSL